MPTTPSTVAQTIATAAGNNMANLPTPMTTWQTLIAAGNLVLAAFVDALRTGISYTTVSAFLNGWLDGAGSFGSSAVGYIKDASGRVYLRGIVKSGTINTTAFQLPAGFRPTGLVSFATNSNNAFGTVTVDTSGNVIPQIGNNTFVYLDGVHFVAA